MGSVSRLIARARYEVSFVKEKLKICKRGTQKP